MTDLQMTPNLDNAQIEMVAEMNVLANILAAKYRGLVDVYVKDIKLSPQDAVAAAAQKNPAVAERAMKLATHDVAWVHLLDLQRVDPDRMVQRWNEIKADAQDELVSGHYAVSAVGDTPFARAQFLAIRSAFTDQWQPQNQGEQVLIDMLAQLFVSHLDWLQTLQTRAGLTMKKENDEVKRSGRWRSQRVSETEAIEQAGLMVDRFNRLFVRTLRAMRDLRRYSVNVNISNPAQVNIASQQINAKVK